MAPLTPLVEVFETILALVYIPAALILLAMGAAAPVAIIEWVLPVSTITAVKVWLLTVLLVLSVGISAVSLWSLLAAAVPPAGQPAV
jgi:hypothetical protein